MSDIDLSIGGRSFRVACAPGEEAHIAGLGRSIDAKLTAMGGAAGQSETRTLLFAALLLADELHDRAGGKAPPPPPPPPEAPKPDPAIANALDAMADRLEKLASALERGATDA